jgi:hypothetical protein
MVLGSSCRARQVKGQLLTQVHAQNQVCGAYTTERCAKYRLKCWPSEAGWEP